MHRTRPTPLRAVSTSIGLLVLLGTFLTATAAPVSAADPLISQGRPVTASSTENGGTPASAAVDGNTGTRWASAFADPQWLQVDLGSSTTISRVVLRWEAAYARAFTVQTSANGSSWTTVHTTTNGAGGVQDLAVSGSGRYVRVHGTQRATQYGYSLWEFQVYGASTGTQPPPPSGPIVRVSEFLADCPFSHRLPDDPIIYPGLPGASHMHSFFGSRVTDAHTELADLQVGATNCNPSVDVSSYWVPTFYVNDQPVEPTIVTFYYLGEGVRDDIIANIQPLPLGLRIVAGNARATSPNESIARWSCLHHNEAGASKDFLTCPAGSMIESYLDFPQCWNGRDLDSADHKSHMAYPVGGACPSTHPVAVPKLRQVLRYPANGNPAGRFRLASGAGYTMHGDFFNAWPEAEMLRRVQNCIRPVIKCGANGWP
ncbi:hypothetical protein GCM10009557_66380 [Virgisporangium ochraceum]|uniref:F5/8 type C domain-containing protein n=1 Tax=Virgisporangium ochraceum TaxID=65505 RepID=A0A8J4A0K9_9ACTN|nr:DUF1996 domain-containing protein [Virgisporangium ochraceum]GIJ71753.1 hypothetical protein Voc01_066700 [Virgisporangium ochraceum]